MGPIEVLNVATVWRVVPFLVLAWLAIFFGATLRAGQVPMIERIARVGDPALQPALCRYTRRLTAVWCIYFVIAAVLSLTLNLPFGWSGALVWSGVVVLFVGEYWLRRYVFTSHKFPGLFKQLRDTWTVWHPRP